MDVTFDDDLAEAYMGDWEGKRFEDILAADEEMLHRIRNQEPIWRHAPSVEELDAFRARVRDAVERAFSPRQEVNVLIVCHCAVINAYVAPLVLVDHVGNRFSIGSGVAFYDGEFVRTFTVPQFAATGEAKIVATGQMSKDKRKRALTVT